MATRDDEPTAEQAAEDDSSRPARVDPWNWLPDLFESWRPMVGRRMPDLFEQMPFGEMIRVEETREDDTLVIRAEIPGVDPDEDIDLTVADGRLTIAARREQREETDDEFRTEFRYGSFERTRTVPAGTRAEDVEATYHDGILEVRVPIGEAGEARRKIPVSRKT